MSIVGVSRVVRPHGENRQHLNDYLALEKTIDVHPVGTHIQMAIK